MAKKETAVVAAEIAISYAGNSFEELQEVIKKIREICNFDHKLTVGIEEEVARN